MDKITYVYRDNPKSITRSNNREYLISGLEGFCYNMKWAMDEALKRGVDKSIAPKLTTSTLVSLYYTYLYTMDWPNNKDILKYGKTLMPYYEKTSEDYLKECFEFKEKLMAAEKKEYKKTITF